MSETTHIMAHSHKNRDGLNDHFLVTVNQQDYIYEPLIKAVRKYLPQLKIVFRLPEKSRSIFHYGEYEQLDIDKLIQSPTSYFANSYIYRKGLIRKHFLSHTIHSYVVKNPNSILSDANLESFRLELDYAEFLDDALDENWELRQELEKKNTWWIVKPSMSDRGQGIRIFRTIEDLQAVFDSFDEDDTDDEGDHFDDNKIVISQLRHFIIQRYLDNPLLLPSMGNKKFHIRCYISCRGALEVYVYDRMLALFAPIEFIPLRNDGNFSSTAIPDLECHLTNTCLQTRNVKRKDISVVEFDAIADLSHDDKSKIKVQIHQIARDIFLGALKVNAVNFQPLPNAFETYGVDFLVDSYLNVKILEVNAYPDFKQTGEELKQLIDELFDHIVHYLITPFFNRKRSADHSRNFIKVLEFTPNNW